MVCPSHLVKQWKDEIEKFSDLKVRTLTTITHLKEMTYQDVVETGNKIETEKLWGKGSTQEHVKGGREKEPQRI